MCPVEREARTKQEFHVIEARARSVQLLHYAEQAYKYMHGEAGDPAAIEAAYKSADALRYAFNSALSARLARLELERKARERQRKRKASAK